MQIAVRLGRKAFLEKPGEVSLELRRVGPGRLYDSVIAPAPVITRSVYVCRTVWAGPFRT